MHKVDRLRVILDKRTKQKGQNKKDKLTEKMAHLSANNEESLELLKSKIKELEMGNQTPNCRFGKWCRRLFCRFNHRYLFVKVNNIEIQKIKRKVSECTLSVHSTIEEKRLKKHLPKHTELGCIIKTFVSEEIEDVGDSSESESDESISESDFEDTCSEESSENEAGEDVSDDSLF